MGYIESLLSEYSTTTKPLSRGFGVEFEYQYTGDLDSYDQAEQLAEYSGLEFQFESYGYHAEREGASQYPCWTLTTDGTAGMEIVSPPLYGEEGLKQIEELLSAVQQIGDMRVTSNCGLHVHWGLETTTVETYTKFVANYIKWEKAIDLLVPVSRRGKVSYELDSSFRDDFDMAYHSDDTPQGWEYTNDLRRELAIRGTYIRHNRSGHRSYLHQKIEAIRELSMINYSIDRARDMFPKNLDFSATYNSPRVHFGMFGGKVTMGNMVDRDAIKIIRSIENNFSSQRYLKLNLGDAYSRHKTLEVRQHSGTLNFVKTRRWIMFLDWLWRWSEMESTRIFKVRNNPQAKSLLDYMLWKMEQCGEKTLANSLRTRANHLERIEPFIDPWYKKPPKEELVPTSTGSVVVSWGKVPKQDLAGFVFSTLINQVWDNNQRWQGIPEDRPVTFSKHDIDAFISMFPKIRIGYRELETRLVGRNANAEELDFELNEIETTSKRLIDILKKAKWILVIDTSITELSYERNVENARVTRESQSTSNQVGSAIMSEGIEVTLGEPEEIR